MTIGSLVRDEQHTKLLSRGAIQGFELGVLEARGKMDSSKGRQYLQPNGIQWLKESDIVAPHGISFSWKQLNGQERKKY